MNAEWVVVKNTASRAKNLRGWFIREKKRPCHRAPGVGPRTGQVRAYPVATGVPPPPTPGKVYGC
jgi:hypothetical protein